MITITQKNLFHTLSFVANTLHKNATNEYAQAVLIQYSEEGLFFQTTNMQASTKTVCKDIQGSLESDVCVNFYDLFEIIKKYKQEEELTLSIQIENNVEYLKISKGMRSFAELPTQKAENFPQPLNITNKNSDKEDNTITFNKEDLRSAIEKTHFCIYANETRYSINGLHFNFQSQNKQIDVVSTDGHRLAKFTIEGVELKSDAKIIIPRSIVAGIKKDIEHAHSEIIFTIDGGKLQIDFGSHTLITQLIDAEFPNYNKVKPLNLSAVIKAHKPSFLASLDRVQSIIQTYSDPKVIMHFKNNEIQMFCNHSQKKTSELLNCEFGGSFALAINAHYTQQCLHGISSKDFEIHIEENNAQSPIQIEDAEDKRFLYIVMPIKNQ